jgi:tetratricopeptide (TPR) repeat protein
MKKPAPRSKSHAQQASGSSALPASTGKETRAAPEGAAPAEAMDGAEQARAFEAAITLFHRARFASAKELFEKAARGPSREMSHTALLHSRMCDRRIAGAAQTPKTAEEHYNYAVALMNQRRIEAAEQHLRQALAEAPDNDHLYYVLALCRGLGGDLAGACVHMRRAIELQPRNRIMARNDPDFAEIGQQPPLQELLYPEKTGAN